MGSESYWIRQQRRLGRRRLLAGAAGAAGLLSAGMVACTRRSSSGTAGSSTAQETPKPGGTYNTYSTDNIILDPHLTSTGNTAESAGLSRLFRFKSGTDPAIAYNHDAEPDLALSAESPDAITWTAKLRTDAKFHNIPPVNGHAVEAEDIKSTFVRAATKVDNPNRGALGMIDPTQIQTPDAHTVVFKLNYPYAPFLKTLTSPYYSSILPREASAGGYDPTQKMIGSGPFVFDSLTRDVAWVFKKNPEWFVKDQPYIDTLRGAIIPADTQRLAQYLAGNLDEVQPSQNDVPTVQRGRPGSRMIVAPATNSEPIWLQLGDPTGVFQDVRARRALGMAIDRDSLGRSVYGGQYDAFLYVPPSFGKWSLKIEELDPNIAQYYKYNPAQAKQLLQAAGLTNLEIKYAYVSGGFGNSASYKSAAQAINAMLNAVGIKTQIVIQDYTKDYIAGGKGNRAGYFAKDMVLYTGAPMYTDPDELIYIDFHSKSPMNQQHLNDPKLDAMIDKSRTLVKEDERLAATKDIQKYMAEQMYVVSTCGGRSVTFVQPEVHNYCPTVRGGELTESDAKLWIG